jgi:hypothetical protein
MFGTGLVAGIFLGVNIGVVIGCLFASARKREIEDRFDSPVIDAAVMAEMHEANDRMPLKSGLVNPGNRRIWADKTAASV